MDYLQIMTIGIVSSFFGSIPPGTLNLTILQLSLENKVNIAFRFAIAVAIVEYPYAWIGVQFEYFLMPSGNTQLFQLLVAITMTSLGLYDLFVIKPFNRVEKKIKTSGFRRGLIMSLLNPMVIPYWATFTVYLQATGWINLRTQGHIHSYILGITMGTFILLATLIFFAKRLSSPAQNNKLIKIISGLILLGLGLYAWWKYFFHN